MRIIEDMKKNLSEHRRGAFGELGSSGIAIVVLVSVLAFGALIVSQIQATMTVNSTQYNIAGTGLTALNNMSTLVSPLGIVLIAAVILGVLMFSFAQGGRR